MKARVLKELLNNTEYSISNHETYIAVGSPMCHDLIKVDKSTLKVTYALDTFNEGRKYLEGKTNSKGENELLFIWDKLHELIKSGLIHNIINGKDIIENPLPIFTVENGVVVESITDKYGWPNTDDNGVCMYDNTHFPTREQAVEYGISEYSAAIRNVTDNVNRIEAELAKAKERLEKYTKYFENLSKEKNFNK